MPDVLIDTERGDIIEPGLVLSQLDQLGFNGAPHRLPRRAELTGDTVHGGVLAAQLPDRPADSARGDRPAPGDQTWELLHERPPRASHLVASPDPLPPHDRHPRHAGHVMKHPSVASAAGRDDPTRGAIGRRWWRRDRHHQQPVATVDALDMDIGKAQQNVVAGTRISRRARISAPRSRVKHVEVLVVDQVVSASDPRGPRPLPATPHPASLTPTQCPKSQ